MIKKGSLYVYDFEEDNKVDIGIVISKTTKVGEITESFWLKELSQFHTDLFFHRYTNIAPSVLGEWK